MNKITILFFLCFLIPAIGLQAGTKKKKDQKEKTETKAKTEYDKLFATPDCQTEKGMITLHKKDGKIYFEFPLALFEREMLLGSTIKETASNDEGLVGQKPHDPLHIYFTKGDSTVQLRYVFNYSITNAEDQNIQNAIDESNVGAIIENFDIKCWNNDKTAVVFDVTDFFVSDRYEIDPFDPYSASTYYGWMLRITKFKKERSFVGDIKAFDDNISINSHLSFTITMRALGMFEYQTDKPFTAEVTRSLVLLPEKPMRPRFSDPRIGVFYTGKMKYANDDHGVKVIYYANRWRLEPKDTAAFKSGKLVEPIKPIVYYIDPEFPEMWKQSITQGIEDWNLAFEKIGFKNAVQVRPFPTDDPEFDPNNIKYSCVIYAPNMVENAMGPSWVDPRSGEILNASVYMNHNLVSLLYNWRMVQTAAVDPRVRTLNLPEDILSDAIRYVSRHEVGHTLGLMHNMAASNAFPTDSLRSASFTQKYGTTPSIMDYARFNYVAQPGDLEKGVKLTPPILGQYDYYAINWIYSPILEAKTAEEEIPVLDRWISEKAGDPIYRYGKQQIYMHYDPSAMEEDLGDDPIKSATYGIKNLKYVVANIDNWLDKDDKDYSFRDYFYYTTLNQLQLYLRHVDVLIGGIYLNERYVGDPRPSYQSVPKAKQKEAVQFLLKAQEDMAWLDNETYFKNISIVGSIANHMQVYTMANLINGTKRLALCADKSDDPYTEKEYLQDIYDYVWKSTIKRRNLTEAEIVAQREFVNSMIAKSNVETGQQADRVSGWGIANQPSVEEWLAIQMYQKFGYRSPFGQPEGQQPVASVGFQRMVDGHFSSMAPTFYFFLEKCQTLLEQAKNTGDENTRSHYALMLQTIKKALTIK
ncbi:zinc-dependent metalloprotease [Butyricimonas synergistica]|uniref:zinc-dependent metalloprotease n=1 Tax=Butyricimonas synergistica TaxID=544644 RepID=UPI00058FDD48|nr:zinc-dependent metalloprotease [Butyricimonas synergistica]